MTLSEIETILQELSERHPLINEELLTTLLRSAGWEEKTIKETLVLFAQRKVNPVVMPAVVVPQVVTDVPLKNIVETVQNLPLEEVVALQKGDPITFYQPDGTEEGELKVFSDVPVAKQTVGKPEKVNEVVASKIEPQNPVLGVVVEVAPSPIVENKVPTTKETVAGVSVDAQQTPEKKESIKLEETKSSTVMTQEAPAQTPHYIPLPVTTEPQSLVYHEDVPEKRNEAKQAEIPSNLPLLPFESSPHIWSFSKYKDVFHSDSSKKEEIQVISVMPQATQVVQNSTLQKPEEEKKVTFIREDKEVVVESVPLRKDDKALVFLAGVMLLAIILILGYMYSNGRL